MIQINLLPDEYKRATTVPPKSLAVLGVVSLLGFGSLGALGYLFFTMRSEASSRVEIAQEQLNNLRPRSQYADALEKEKADFEKRNSTISEIAASRILWTKKLDRLSAIVNEDRSTGRHMVWLEQLDIDSRVDTAAGGVKLRGHSATANVENVSNFHEDLQADPVFAEGFETFTAPGSKRGELSEDLEPAEQMDFDFQVLLPAKKKKR